MLFNAFSEAILYPTYSNCIYLLPNYSLLLIREQPCLLIPGLIIQQGGLFQTKIVLKTQEVGLPYVPHAFLSY